MRKISWLHISDLHLSPHCAEGWNQIKRAFLKKITAAVNIQPVDFILFSGDLVDDGSYYLDERVCRNFKIFINELIDITKINKQNVFFIPGNHDLIRDKNLSHLKSAEDANLLFTKGNENKRKDYFHTLSAYNKFIKQNYSYIKIKKSLFYVHLLKLDNKINKHITELLPTNILIVGLNSSWNDLGKDDESSLSKELKLTESQIDLIIEEISRIVSDNKIDLSILMMHHDPNIWIAPSDKNYLEKNLLNKIDFVAVGHNHSPSNSRQSSPIIGDDKNNSKQVNCIHSGALFEKTQKYINFIIQQVDITKLRYTVSPFRYDEREKEFYLDVNIMGSNKPKSKRYVKKSVKLDIKKEYLQFFNNITTIFNKNDTDILRLKIYSEMIFEKNIVNPKFLYSDFKGAAYYIDLINSQNYQIENLTKRQEIEFFSHNIDKGILKDFFKYNCEEEDMNSVNYISLGVGNGSKDIEVLKKLLKKKIKINFFPIDFSYYLLKYALTQIYLNFEKEINQNLLQIFPYNIDFEKTDLRSLFKDNKSKKLYTLFGATLGNFSNEEKLLKNIIASLNTNDIFLFSFINKKSKKPTEGYGDRKDINFIFSPFSHKYNLSHFLEANRLFQDYELAYKSKLSVINETLSFSYNLNSEINDKTLSNIYILGHSNRYCDKEFEKFFSSKFSSMKILDIKEAKESNYNCNIYLTQRK